MLVMVSTVALLMLYTDAEYCTLRSEEAVRIPTDMEPAEIAPLLCAGVTLFNSVRKMQVTPGDIVAVQGLGGLGKSPCFATLPHHHLQTAINKHSMKTHKYSHNPFIV